MNRPLGAKMNKMKNDKFKKLLIPDFNDDIEYEIYKNERLIVNQEDSNPFERNYFIEMRKIKENLFEFYYPNSVLRGIRFLRFLEDYYDEIIDPSNQTIYITINKNNDIIIENLEELKSGIDKVMDILKVKIKDKDKKDYALEWLDFIKSDDEINRFYLEDIGEFFCYYGIEKRDNVYVVHEEKETQFDKFIDKLTRKIGIGLSSMNVTMFDYLNEGEYKIESLRGNDTISTETRQDFNVILDEFLSGKFDFKVKHDMTLHYEKYIYDSNNILLEYSYESKVDTPKMKKIKEVKIMKCT